MIINVKRLAATNNQGTRIKISAEGAKSLTIWLDYSMNYDDNARVALQAFAIKNDFYGDFAGYIDSDGNGTYVLTDSLDHLYLGELNHILD